MDNLDNGNLKEIVLSVLFVAGDGVEKDFLAEKLNVSNKDIEKAIASLKEDYAGKSGIHIIEYKNKVQLSTNPDYASYISDVLNPIRSRIVAMSFCEPRS